MSSTSFTKSKPSGLAIVGYGMTGVGFLQVAVTIAPQVAEMIPAAGGAAMYVGVAVALAADVVWAALMHTTLQVYKSGQRGPAAGFGAATLAAVAASTVLLAAVGHMGPWSAIPALAALLLVADGVRDHVTVSPETAAQIRARQAEIRDARALAAIEARHAAHEETIAGYQESQRLAARTKALADIKVTVEQAENKASRRLKVSAKKHKAGAAAYRELMSNKGANDPGATEDNGAAVEGSTEAPMTKPEGANGVSNPQVAEGATQGPESGDAGATVTRLASVPERPATLAVPVDLEAMTIDEKRTMAAQLYSDLQSWDGVSEAMGAPRTSVRRWAREAEADAS